MYENFSEIIDTTGSNFSDPDSSRLVDRGMDGSSAILESDLDSPYSVSGSDSFVYYVPVSQLDVESVDSSLLQGIDFKLSLIVFFLLVSWCFARIRNAVRSFTGRSVEDEKR